jgi:hypothetical protein
MIIITCYGGVGTIGGNKILLEDEAGPSTGSGRLFFDFGTPPSRCARSTSRSTSTPAPAPAGEPIHIVVPEYGGRRELA